MENKYKLTKSRARQKIEISPDLKMDPTGWFININYIDKKTGIVKHTQCIIEKDLPTWLDFLKKLGWNIEN